MDGGPWSATVHGVPKSRTRLSDFTFTYCCYFHMGLWLLFQRKAKQALCFTMGQTLSHIALPPPLRTWQPLLDSFYRWEEQGLEGWSILPKVTQLVIHTAELGFKPRLTDWWGFPGGSDSKESTCNAGDPGSIPGLGRSPLWRREWPPTPVFLPGEFHGQRSLEGYSPWSHRVGRDWATNTFTLLFHYWLTLRSLSTCCGLCLAETILTRIYRTPSMGQVSSCGAGAVVTQTAVPALVQLILCWGKSFPSFTWNFISQSPKDQVFPGCSEVTSWLVAPIKSTQHTEPRRTRSYPSLPQSLPKAPHHSENQISSSSVSIVTLLPNTVRVRVSLSHTSCPSSWWPHDLQVLTMYCFVCSSSELTARPV